MLDERLELQRFPFDRQMFRVSAEFINAKLVEWVRVTLCQSLHLTLRFGRRTRLLSQGELWAWRLL